MLRLKEAIVEGFIVDLVLIIDNSKLTQTSLVDQKDSGTLGMYDE